MAAVPPFQRYKDDIPVEVREQPFLDRNWWIWKICRKHPAAFVTILIGRTYKAAGPCLFMDQDGIA